MITLIIEPDNFDFWVRIGAAIICGTIVGLERHSRGKSFGIRTSILICLGSTLFCELGMAVVDNGANDPSRVLGQIVTGVGFLGAGAIITRGGAVVGLTSAASIWILAGIGAAIGLGHWQVALLLSFVVITVLRVVEFLEQCLPRLFQKDSSEDEALAQSKDKSSLD